MFCDMHRQRGRVGQPDKVVISHIDKIDLAAACKFAAPGRDQHQAIFTKGKSFEMLRKGVFGGKAEIGRAAGNGADNIGALALLDVQADVGIFAQESGQRPGQMLRQAGRVGEQVDVCLDATGKGRKIALHHRDILHDEAGVIAKAFTGGGQFNAAAPAPDQQYSEAGFEPLDPGARRCKREMGPRRAMGNAAAVRYRNKKLKVNQIETHGKLATPSAFAIAEGSFNNLHIVPAMTIGQCCAVSISLLIFTAAAFLLAGFVKGVLGLGLPTVSMGLLAVAMPPVHALAIVIVPAILTNIWQTFVGPYLRDILVRLWPLMLGLAVGIRLNAGMMTGPYARYGSILLGILLVIYAVVSLRKFVFTISRRDEKWTGAIVGLVTGVISAATGVQVVPSMPYFQAIGMEKDELVQALGVFFTVATLMLAFNLSVAGVLDQSTALPGVIALACSFTGMAIGQTVRTRLEPDVFRRWFLISMILLGIYLAGAAGYEIYFA
jgi:uncharacterized protein